MRRARLVVLLCLAGVVVAQTIATIQGNDAGARRLVAVDSLGRLLMQISATPSGSAVVVGNNAAGAAPTAAPVLAGGYDGTFVRRVLTDTAGRVEVNTAGSPAACNASAPVVVATSGLQVVIPVSRVQSIWICSVSLAGTSGAQVRILAGTGSTCATNRQILTGATALHPTFVLALASPLRAPVGTGVCFDVGYLGGGAWGGGLVTYSYN